MTRLKQDQSEIVPTQQNIDVTFNRASRLTDLSGQTVEFRLGDWDITLYPGVIKLPR